VATIADVQKLMDVGDSKIYGVIIGRALYTGAISLTQALEMSKKPQN
jgi:phosphoribosylformimino-5-aminoimidazole carboxamide ribonucleotide (ProFAR) isomerase